MATRSERVKALLAKVYEEQGAITSVNDLRDFAMEAEEDAENPLNPMYKEVQEFLGDKGRSQVFKEVKQEWPSRIRKPTKPGVLAVLLFKNSVNAEPLPRRTSIVSVGPVPKRSHR